ncbi:SDR family NAD(P)-dependent oxidoreductase [Paenibacillus glycanilyticus]|uniref:SDR family oxidoreductase n=1 Tax=Paenibacillus glycanilyticus TaxID=126569 RepID=UPI0020416D26|nr:SDR family NAD(P)-dependent oxidoreductase [Paenibacillus glycanilyticus]MCM3628585.1 SDR family NAD(P)-dependent oxidoreductase [Paenibacillus glycanilyticus]
MKLQSNTILITGGASGIGLELAGRLLEKGNTVIIAGRDREKLDKAKAQYPKLHAFSCDVTDPAAIAELYNNVTAQFPDLNVLINNAGQMRKINLLANELVDINSEIATNLSGPVRMVNQFLPHLLKRPASAIMNVSSALAFVPFAISPVYGATKAGIHSYTQSLRAQLKNTSVQVFELAPPLTKTTLVDAFGPNDMKGSVPMETSKLIDHVIAAMERDQLEIRPGQSNLLKLMSRLAPNFIFKQLSKSVDAMLADSGK